MILKKINYLAVLICVVLGIIISMVWYMPFAFGGIWSGITGQPVNGPPVPFKLIIGIISTVIVVFSIAVIFKLLKSESIFEGILIGIIIAIGIIAAVCLPINIYNGFDIRLYFIDTGLSVLNIIIYSFILSIWK